MHLFGFVFLALCANASKQVLFSRAPHCIKKNTFGLGIDKYLKVADSYNASQVFYTYPALRLLLATIIFFVPL
jgi:hypothetical protein